ncbi:MAG: pyroglutamyl-peptidase I [Ruminococcaceae bacterium]|nr:pyroglutamyl-peptidase I [Oscillospiraceae bacterium]
MRVLVTGFDSFGGESINPSWEAVKRLPDEILGAEIIKKQLPTEFIAGERELLSALKSAEPSIVICAGQAAGRSAVSIERVAINLRDASIADNALFTPVDEAVSPEGEAAYFVTLPVKAALAALKEAGIPAELSLSAGSFVCNDILYTLLRSTEGTGIAAGFVHVPLCPAQAEKKSPPPPSMSIEDMAKALEIILTKTIKTKETEP